MQSFFRIKESEILQSLVFMFLLTIVTTALKQPFSLYSIFVIEEKFGFNKQTLGLYLKDELKTFGLTIVIGFPVTAVILWVIQIAGVNAWFYVWICLVLFSLVMLLLYPTVIVMSFQLFTLTFLFTSPLFFFKKKAPLFNKFTPLAPGNLRDSITEICKNSGFKQVFVVDASTRSSHSNAYFFGFFCIKRIVLYDTLIKQMKKTSDPLEEAREENKGEKKIDSLEDISVKSVEENLEMYENEEIEKVPASLRKKIEILRKGNQDIVAVMAHELGHYQLSHNLKGMVIGWTQMLAFFWLFSKMVHDKNVYASFGFHTQPAFIGLILFSLLYSPVDHLLGFLMNVLTRRFEYEADKFATVDKKKDLRDALIKLHLENLSNMIVDSWYSSYHFSHPHLLERLKAIEQLRETIQKKD